MAMERSESAQGYPLDLESRSRALTPPDKAGTERPPSARTLVTGFTEAERQRASIYLIEREAIRLRRLRLEPVAEQTRSFEFDTSLNQYERPAQSLSQSRPHLLRRALDRLRALFRRDKDRDKPDDQWRPGGMTTHA